MNYRIVKLFWDASREEEAITTMDSLRSILKTLNPHSITEVNVGEGESVMIAIHNSKEDAEKANSLLKK